MSSNSFLFSFQENEVHLNSQNFISSLELTIEEYNLFGKPPKLKELNINISFYGLLVYFAGALRASMFVDNIPPSPGQDIFTFRSFKMPFPTFFELWKFFPWAILSKWETCNEVSAMSSTNP